jgi:YidC/Oxa1 family membrane protein insertase
MEKRALLALVLSLGVILAWNVLFPPTPPAPEQPVPVREGTEIGSGAVAPPPSPEASRPREPSPTTLPEEEPEPAEPAEAVLADHPETVVLENDLVRVELANRGAAVISLQLPGYRSDARRTMDMVGDEEERRPAPLAISLAQPEATQWLAQALHRVERTSSNEIRFEAADGQGLHSVRSYRLEEDGTLAFFGEIQGADGVQLSIGPGARPFSVDEATSRYVVGGAVVRTAGDLDRTAAAKFKEPKEEGPGLLWAGLDDNYFVAVIDAGESARYRFVPVDVPLTDDQGEVKKPVRRLRLEVVPAGSTYDGRLVFSPKELSRLTSYGIGLEETLDFGWSIFGSLAKVFLVALRWLHGFLGNWGLAIILLTVIIRGVLFPFTFKSTVAMKRMQELAPEQEKIREKYRKKKNDPDARARMNQEIMALYQEKGINPAAGCMPILFQLPIFIGLYNLLAHAIELRHAEFVLWISDLSAKDPYYVLPILMGGTWLAQTAVTPTTADPMQKKIFLFMPIFFTIVMLGAPSGLTLYFFISNLLSIVQMLVINRLTGTGADRKARS